MVGLNHDWKRELESIPIPAELHRHSLSGISRAQKELDESLAGGNGKAALRRSRKSTFTTVAVALLVIILTITACQPQMIAGIQKMLQHVPGIGIVKQNARPMNRYVLEQPVTAQIGKGQIIVSGVLVDEEMTYLVMSGNLPSQKPDEILLENQDGTEFVVKRSMSSESSNQWTADFWHRGKLDIQDGPAKIMIEQLDRAEIPLTLVKAEAFGSYEEMGETAVLHDISITAVASRDGSKGRLSLFSQQPDNITIVDYGVYGIYNGRTLSVTDAAGNRLETELIRGTGGPARDFFFNLDADKLSEIYTLHIPEINVKYNDHVTVKVPTQSVEHLNHTFSISGFPVTITRTERLEDDVLRLYLDLHFNANADQSLHRIALNGMSHSGKLNEQTGAMEYIEFAIEPGMKEIKLKIAEPEVLIRGPWSFRFQTDKYFNS